jgi:hypothetical protein
MEDLKLLNSWKLSREENELLGLSSRPNLYSYGEAAILLSAAMSAREKVSQIEPSGSPLGPNHLQSVVEKLNKTATLNGVIDQLDPHLGSVADYLAGEIADDDLRSS